MAGVYDVDEERDRTRRARWGTAALVLGFAASLGGCRTLGGQIREGMTRYEVGNYNAAVRVCRELGPREAELNDKAHLRYLVYCGLSHYRVGQREAAREFLSAGAEEYAEGRQSWLKPAIVDDLYKALDDLDGRPRSRSAIRAVDSHREARGLGVRPISPSAED